MRCSRSPAYVDEVERRRAALTQREADLSQSSNSSLARRRCAPRSLQPIVKPVHGLALESDIWQTVELNSVINISISFASSITAQGLVSGVTTSLAYVRWAISLCARALPAVSVSDNNGRMR